MLKYLIILILLFAAELIYFWIADHLNIIDRPNLRSSHTFITLRGGGIIFVFGAWLWAAFFGLQYPWFMAGLTLISLVSFADDVHSVRRRVRLTIHFLSMFMMFYQLELLQWNMWLELLVAIIFNVGIVNAYNFMDGINGITGGYSLVVLVPLLLENSLPSSVNAGFIDKNLLIVIILSVLVFCFFNFRTRAKCFAGDVGAVGIAFIIVFALGLLILKSGDLSYIMLLAVYGVDAVLTIIHRIMLKERLGDAHRKHAYQIMANELKIPHVVVTTIYMVLQLIISTGLILSGINHYLYSAVVLVLLCIAYVVFMKKYYYLHEEYLKSVEQI